MDGQRPVEKLSPVYFIVPGDNVKLCNTWKDDIEAKSLKKNHQLFWGKYS
jgi:hypothetical protein